MKYCYLLSLLVFSACEEGILLEPDSHCRCVGEYPAATCESPKIACTCPPPEYPPPNPTTCPDLVFSHLNQAFNTYDWFFYASLLSPDFRFIDETIGVDISGKEPEVRTIERVFSYYRHDRNNNRRDLQYYPRDFLPPRYLSLEETADGCQVACGLMEMLIHEGDYPYTRNPFGFEVSDKTCMTVCPNNEDDLWYLTEWRILESVPPPSTRRGFEVVTWGEVRRRKDIQQ